MSTSFELELDDSSPVIRYFPFAETLGAPNLLAGWNSYFSQSGFLTELGEAGLGTSLHVTSLDGAAITIEWFGTGITLFGGVVNATYDVSLDGIGLTPGLPHGDTLVTFQNLEPQQHFVALVAHPSASASNSPSYLAFDRAALNVSTGLADAKITNQFIPVQSSRWDFSGDWAQHSDLLLASEPSPVYSVTTSRANTASISFNGSAVSVMGIRNATSGHYNVTLDDTTTTFDGHSDWLESSTLFLQAGLDKDVQHSLTITNADDESLAIFGLNITVVSGGTPMGANSSSGLSPSTIVAIVLGVLVGLLAVVSVGLCIFFHRRERRARRSSFTTKGVRPSIFSDLGAPWSPSYKHKYRPTHVSKNSDPDLQDLYTAQPITTGNLSGTGWDRLEEHPRVRISTIDPDDISPSSPVPYLRISKQSSFKVDWEAPKSIENGQIPLDKTEGNKDDVTKAMDELLDELTHADNGVVYSTMQTPTTAPEPDSISKPLQTQAYGRRRSVTFDTSQQPRPRLHIPNEAPDVYSKSDMSTPRSARGVRSPLLTSPLRGPRRISRRSSMGTALLTPHAERPATISTIAFGPPSEDHSESGSISNTGPVPPLRTIDPIASEFLERLKARRADKNAPPRSGRPVPRPSSWKAPW